MPSPVQAFSYVRFSTPEQSKGDSLRRQIEGARAYAERHGMDLDESLTDAGVSAFKGVHRTRGSLGSFLAAVDAGRVPKGSVLIVENLDRLSRERPLDALDGLRAILRAGVDVVTLSDGRRYSDTSLQADFFELLGSLFVMARAHEESARKGERVGAAWGQKRARAARGEAMTRACVAWCRMVGQGAEARYELIPERAEIVRRIFRMAAGGQGRRQIVKALNGDGTPPFGRSAGWQDSYVAKILESRATMGFYQPHRVIDGRRVPEGDEIQGYYPPVITEEEFHLARAATQRRRGRGGRQGAEVVNILSGLARCGACGSAMIHVNKGPLPKGGRWLVCDGRRRGLPCSNRRPNLRYEAEEDLIVLAVPDLDLAAVATDARGSGERPEDERERLVEQRAKLGREIEALLDSFGSNAAPTRVRDRIAKLSDEEKQCAERLRELDDEIALRSAEATTDRRAAYSALVERLDTAQGEELRLLRLALATEIRRVVSRIIYKNEGVTVEGRNGRTLFTGISILPPPRPGGRVLHSSRELRRMKIRAERAKE